MIKEERKEGGKEGRREEGRTEESQCKKEGDEERKGRKLMKERS